MSAETFYLQKEINEQRMLLKQYELKETMGSTLSIGKQLPNLLNLASGQSRNQKALSDKTSANPKTWIGKSVILIDSFQQAMKIGRRLQQLFQKSE